MKEVAKLSIEGMHCGACVMRVKNALGTLPGVEVNTVEVGSATVAFEEGISVGTIAGAVEAIGFPTRVEA